MTHDFTGRTAVITGAAHGFGRAIARALARYGASVWACDILGAELAETARLCAEAGGRCEGRVVDVSDPEAVEAFVSEVLGADGGVDILVNDAGGVLGQVGRPLEEVTPAEWKAIFAGQHGWRRSGFPGPSRRP